MTLRTSILLCTCLLLLFTTSFSQQRAPRYFSEKLLQLKIDSLRSNFGMHKTLPEKYELEALVALSYFPELEQSTINFKIKKIRSTMAARPAGIQFLRGKGKRKYNVILNNSNPEVPLDSASFNAKIGIIGHEFAHIVDYENKSTLKLISNAFGYANSKFRAKFEKDTDRRTISHGLFWQCFDFSSFAFHYHKANPRYLEYKRKYYLSPEEIMKLE